MDESPQSGGFAKLGCVVIVLGFLAFAILLNINPRTSQTAGSVDDKAVYLTATKIVQNFLKSPTTAKFASAYEGQAGAERTRHGTWRVWGYVDSQNSFGAMIRSRWSMEAEVLGEKVQAKEIIIDGQKVFP